MADDVEKAAGKVSGQLVYRGTVVLALVVLGLLGWSIERNLANYDETLNAVQKINERQNDALVGIQITQQGLTQSVQEINRVNAAQDNRLDRFDDRLDRTRP